MLVSSRKETQWDSASLRPLPALQCDSKASGSLPDSLHTRVLVRSQVEGKKPESVAWHPVIPAYVISPWKFRNWLKLYKKTLFKGFFVLKFHKPPHAPMPISSHWVSCFYLLISSPTFVLWWSKSCNPLKCQSQVNSLGIYIYETLRGSWGKNIKCVPKYETHFSSSIWFQGLFQVLPQFFLRNRGDLKKTNKPPLTCSPLGHL